MKFDLIFRIVDIAISKTNYQTTLIQHNTSLTLKWIQSKLQQKKVFEKNAKSIEKWNLFIGKIVIEHG